MNSEIKVLIIFSAILIFILVGGLFLNSQIKIEKKEITIITDKVEYEQGEIVKINIKNNNTQEKVINYPFYSIEKFIPVDTIQSGEWIVIKTILSPCGVLGGLVEMSLKPGEAQNFEWNQKEGRCSDPTKIGTEVLNQVPTGKYRVRSEISTLNSKNKKIFYSNEFTINKKSAEISEEEAIKLANQFLQSKCEANFIGIKKAMVSKTLIYTAGGVCSGLGDYASKYSEIWTINYSLKTTSEEDKSRSIAVLVGLEGNFICGYAIDSRAAPGISSLDDVCSQNQQTTITTDKTEYKTGEQITAALNYKGEIYALGGGGSAWSIQKWETGGWVTLQRKEDRYFVCANIPECKDINLEEIKECLPMTMCEMEIWQKVEGIPTIAWDQFYKSEEKEFQCKLVAGNIAPERIDKRICAVFDQSSSGRYKIRFEYTALLKQDNPSIDDIKYVEKEFIIKEKAVLNPLCSEKVQGFGLCKAYFEGYEFDSGSGKCVKKGVGGCNANIPFRTLEECQKTCEKQIDFYSCVQDSDCIKVKADCCGCNAGGSAAAINKNFKNQWKNNCNEINIACSAVMSNDPSCFQEPECVDNKCVLSYSDVSFKDNCDAGEEDSSITKGIFTENNPDFQNIKFPVRAKI